MARITEKQYSARGQDRGSAGFTLTELLVVISVIALLIAIIVPTFNKAIQTAKDTLNKNNMRQIVTVVNLYAIDNSDSYPVTVSTLGFGSGWNWHDPRTVTSRFKRYSGEHRSMSEYLGSYVEDVDTMYCPSAPNKHNCVQQAWQAGDSWDCPDSSFPQDPFIGTYCFYWNYVGLLADENRLFIGPRTSTGRSWQSKLLVTDYFGYDQYRAEGVYGSCEKYKGSTRTRPESMEEADYWHGESAEMPRITLHAAYTDGHVEEYSSYDTTVMKVIIDPDTSTPYADSLGMGDFFLPLSAIK